MSSQAHSEANVAGDEIIIFTDDSFKPATRDLGSQESSIQTTDSDKSSHLVDTFESQLSDDPFVNSKEDDLWQRIRDGYAIPDSSSLAVAKHEGWYSSRPDYIRRMVERSQKYLFHIVEEVEKRGMPTEIALLPMIESAYNPKAYSTSKASGIWQFIPSTGKHFGLKQNWWVDNRRNVTFATDAALTYLQKLHTMFGAWDLALAAYNAGEGTISRAIERNRKLGLPTDYASLKLPDETKNYVPKLQAIKNLMTNPSNYGLNIQTISNTAYFTKVSAPAQIDAHLAAKLAGISDEEFIALNPSYNRPVVTNNSEKQEILLPIFAAKTFRENLANYNKPLVSWQTYYAKRGERMDQIASKFGIQVSKLRNVNDLPKQNKMKRPVNILVPNGNRSEFNISKNTTQNDAIPEAEKTEVNEDFFNQQNSDNIDLSSTNINQTDYSEKSIEPANTEIVTYKVKKGDNINSIAKRFAVSTNQIKTKNGLKNDQVKIGQTLKIENVKVIKKTKTKNNKSNASKPTKKPLKKYKKRH